MPQPVQLARSQITKVSWSPRTELVRHDEHNSVESNLIDELIETRHLLRQAQERTLLARPFNPPGLAKNFGQAVHDQIDRSGN
jgi:hypothetical protein